MGLIILLATIVITAVLSPFFLVMLMRASKRAPEVDGDGRTIVGLTMGLVVLGMCCAAFCLAIAWLIVQMLIDPHPWDVGTAVFPAVGSLLFVLGGAAVYGVFCIGISFGRDGILYRSAFRRRIVPWDDVNQVVDHPVLGTYLRTGSGRLYMSKYRTGFQQLMAELRSRGVAGAERRSLARVV
ncbi:MAG: hypothetical protein AB7O49_22315 [Sphingomonadales bacterium]